jgi:uncharacterized protein (TIGR03118 family)
MRAFTNLRFKSALIASSLAVVLGASSTGFAQRYSQTNLVSDTPGVAAVTDPNLVNPWGISFSSTSPFWIADNGTGLSTLYMGDGSIVPLVVTIPPPDGGTDPSKPTGTVFNGTTNFVVSANGVSAPSAFLFATEDGTISGWSPTVDRTHAILAVDNHALGSIYKGLASADTPQGSFLYATNFHDGSVEMYDTNFQLVRAFTDVDLPPGFAPFGIRTIRGKLYVTFAKQDADKEDDAAGPGRGFVDVFDIRGNKLSRLISHGALNSPWGLALAPANFGKFSNALLVGNFGNGRINAYDRTSGAFLGVLLDSKGKPVWIDGLWGLAFGNGKGAGPRNALFFTAGPDQEAHGLFGELQAIP